MVTIKEEDIKAVLERAKEIFVLQDDCEQMRKSTDTLLSEYDKRIALLTQKMSTNNVLTAGILSILLGFLVHSLIGG